MCSLLKRKEKYLQESEFKAHLLSEIMHTEKLNMEEVWLTYQEFWILTLQFVQFFCISEFKRGSHLDLYLVYEIKRQ